MRGVETLLLQGIPLQPDATYDKRLPQPDTFLHMKEAQFSPHSCSSAPVYRCAFSSLCVQCVRRWSLLQGQTL